MNQTQEMSKVSIIMPVYNSEKYIKNAVLSVLNQTYKNLELIAVDDGSTDNSLEILNNIKKEDSRLKVYAKENGGISSARNYGIDRATGEYIGFIDNDDEYVPELIADNIKLIVKYNAEIIKFNKIKRILINRCQGKIAIFKKIIHIKNINNLITYFLVELLKYLISSSHKK